MSQFNAAITIICVVLFVAPVAIYIMLKYSDLDRYQKRFRKANPEIFHRDDADDEQ